MFIPRTKRRNAQFTGIEPANLRSVTRRCKSLNYAVPQRSNLINQILKRVKPVL